MTTTSDVTQLVGQAHDFRARHRPGSPLRLANAWDAASARIAADAGGNAVATTSAGMAWSLGFADGEHIGRDDALAQVARICAAVSVPVSADIESGWATDADGVAETVHRVLAAGAVGINIEDAAHGAGDAPLRAVDDQIERISAARGAAVETGVPLFVNARTDMYLRAVGSESNRLDDTLARAAAYVAAGADGVFVPGVSNPHTIAALVTGIDAPVNILVGPGSPSVNELADLGVARVSLGSTVASIAYAVARQAAEELYGAGTYTAVSGGLTYEAANALLASPALS